MPPLPQRDGNLERRLASLSMNSIQSDPSGMDAADNTCLFRLLLDRVHAPVEARVVGVRSRQPVQMLDGTILDQLGCSTDLDVAAGVMWIDDQQADLWVGRHVHALLALQGRVDAGALSVVV